MSNKTIVLGDTSLEPRRRNNNDKSSKDDTEKSEVTERRGRKKKVEIEKTVDTDVDEDQSEVAPLRKGLGAKQIAPPGYNILVSVTVHNGYDFRQFYEFLNQSVDTSSLPLYFSKDGIFINKGNGLETFNCDAFFDKNQLIEYFVDDKRWNDPENQCHVVNVNFKKLYNYIKKISKKESFCLCQYVERQNEIYLSSYGGKSKGFNVLRTELITNNSKYDIKDNVLENSEPNVKIPASDFSNACKEATTSGSETCIIKCSSEGMRIMFSDNLKEVNRYYEWGDFDSRSFYSTKVKKSLLKGLVKTGNFNSIGIISICCGVDGIVRLETNIGSFGNATMHIIEQK